MPWLNTENFHPSHDRNKDKENYNKKSNEIINSLGLQFVACGTHDSNVKHRRPLNISNVDDDNDNDDNKDDNDYSGMTVIKEKNSTIRKAISSTTHMEGSVIVPGPSLRPFINGASKFIKNNNSMEHPLKQQQQSLNDIIQQHQINSTNRFLQKPTYIKKNQINNINNNNNSNSNSNSNFKNNLNINLNNQPNKVIRLVGGHLVDQTKLLKNQEKNNKSQNMKKQNTITMQQQEIERKKLLEKKRNDEIATLLGKRSSHEVDAENQIWKHQEERFDKLIKMEYAQNKNESIESIKLKAFTCAVCRLTTEKYPELCKRSHHRIDTIESLKRFFECTNYKCQKRTSTLDQIIPKHVCECGEYRWKKCGKNNNSYKQLSVEVEDLNKLNDI